MARQGEAADVAAVVAWLDRIPLGSQPNYDAILRAFPGMQLDALVAIWEHRARDYSTRKAQALDRLMDVAVADFLGGLSVEQICWKYKLWPLKVLKFLLSAARPYLASGTDKNEKLLWTEAGKDPGCLLQLMAEGLAPEWESYFHRLSSEFMRFQLEERKYSQRASKYAQIAGWEHECILAARLRNLGLSFKTEEDLRQANCAYTPDALLTVPALVNGHVVHWVDSKAMYGYDASWRYVKEQICNYVAFCGSGLVIFWHGLAPGLQALVGPSVLVLQDLPEPQHITVLPTEVEDLAELVSRPAGARSHHASS